jgi:hypothetical protein
MLFRSLKMNKKINFNVKQKMIALSGACFWFWSSFHNFLKSCGVNQRLLDKYPQGIFTKYSAMTNIINDLEELNRIDIIQQMISTFFQMKSPIDGKDILDDIKAKKLLAEFKELVGDDPIEIALQKKETEEKRNLASQEREEQNLKMEKMESLKKDFSAMFQKTDKLQKRGFDLESLFFEILELEEFEFKKPYKSDGEQIDGHFKYEKFDYLVEIKWTNEPSKQSDLSVFDGKIKNKAQSTRGLFLAINGFDQNSIIKFSGNSPHIILMDGQDLMHILEGRISFFDCMKAKVDALVRNGKIFFKITS